jgi:radical SAM protein with 4Fe4S-binding SPASM domain
LGVHAISFTGGEPLLAPDSLQAGIDKAVALDLLVSLNTNASLLNDPWISYLVNKNVHLLVSFPSSKSGTYGAMTRSTSYDVVVENIRKLTRRGASVTVNMVVGDANVRDIAETGAFAMGELGAGSFRATPISPRRGAPASDVSRLSSRRLAEYFAQIELLMDKNGIAAGSLGAIPFCCIPESLREVAAIHLGCTAGRSIITVGVRGEVRVCSQADFDVGSVSGFASDKDGAALRAALVAWREGELWPEACVSCAELFHCCGGCRMHAYHETGRLNAQDPRMVGPIDRLPDRPSSRRVREPPDPTLYGRRTFCMSPCVRFREEMEGYWSICSGELYDLLNPEALSVVRHYFVGRRPLPAELNPGLLRLVSYLSARGYIEEHDADTKA